MVSEMGFILSSIYINAWVSTYFDNTKEGVIEAKQLAEDISVVTLLMGILFGLLAGFLSDKF
jgi:F0F1-type ATP synthase assembly protein I